MKARVRSRNRGTALIITVVLVVVVLTFGAILIAIPTAGLKGEVAKEEHEAAYLAADAGLWEDALVRLNNGSLTAPGGVWPATGTPVGSPTALHRFGKGPGSGYYYVVSPLYGQSVLKIVSHGFFDPTKGKGLPVEAVVEAIVKTTSTPFTGPGAYTIASSVPNSGLNLTLESNGGGGSVNGTNASYVPGNPSGGPPQAPAMAFTDTINFGAGASSFGLTLDTPQNPLSGAAPPAGSPPPGLSSLPAGSSVGTVPAAGINSLFTSALGVAASPPAGAVVLTAPTGTAFFDLGTVPSSPASPALVIVKPSSVAQLQAASCINGDGTFYGLIIIDLSGLPPGPVDLSTQQPFIQIGTPGSINGMVLLNGPPGPITNFDNAFETQPTTTGISGGLAIQFNNAATGRLGMFTGAGAVTYNQANINMAMKFLNNTGTPVFKVVSSRIVR